MRFSPEEYDQFQTMIDKSVDRALERFEHDLSINPEVHLESHVKLERLLKRLEDGEKSSGRIREQVIGWAAISALAGFAAFVGWAMKEAVLTLLK